MHNHVIIFRASSMKRYFKQDLLKMFCSVEGLHETNGEIFGSRSTKQRGLLLHSGSREQRNTIAVVAFYRTNPQYFSVSSISLTIEVSFVFSLIFQGEL